MPADLTPLFTGLFDDASMYPPTDMKLPEAIRQHGRHLLSWYADAVGALVCTSRLLDRLSREVENLGLPRLDVTAVLPGGLGEVDSLTAAAARLTRLRLVAVELPLRQANVTEGVRKLAPLTDAGVACYLEIALESIDERQVHELSDAGARLKLRPGGTGIDAFRTEAELALPLVLAAAERLPLKCTAGLHHAVRHRDLDSGFQHHGFLNILLAARVAASTGSVSSTASMLADRNAAAIADAVGTLTGRDVAAIRAMLCSFGTCSIDEPIADLLALRLVAA